MLPCRLMINFNFTPNLREGFGISVGISAGYLYSSRQKTVSGVFGKHKTFDDFDLNPWKLSWIAEAQLGPGNSVWLAGNQKYVQQSGT